MPHRQPLQSTVRPDLPAVRVVVEGTSEAGRDILRGVMRYARSHTNWCLRVESKPERKKGQEWALDHATIYATTYNQLMETILSRGHPVVGCLGHHQVRGIPVVRSDDLAIGQMAARYLLDRGFERFIFDSERDTYLPAELRFQGFSQVIRDAGFEVIRRRPPRKLLDHAECRDLIVMLQQMPKPVAVLFSHDTIGRIAADYITAAGLSVPEDVAILGIDNDELQCEIARPPMSSVAIPYFDIGHEAAALLDRILHGQAPPTEPILIAPLGVISRQSTDIVAFEEPRLAEALRYIRTNACNPCSVEDVLDHCRVSRRWLESQFQAQFARSPHQEITRVRIEQAKQLLRDRRLTLRAVAEKAGYKHLQNFVSIFRRTTGQTPAAYRRHRIAVQPPQ